MPVYATFTLIFFLASMGLPLLNGFIGEFMILQAAFLANPVWAYWAVSGVVLGAAYLLWLYQRVFWGKITNEENQHLLDLNSRELATLVPLMVLCFWIGLYPKPFLEFLHKPMGQLAQTVQPGKFTAPDVAHAAEREPAPAAAAEHSSALRTAAAPGRAYASPMTERRRRDLFPPLRGGPPRRAVPGLPGLQAVPARLRGGGLPGPPARAPPAPLLPGAARPLRPRRAPRGRGGHSRHPGPGGRVARRPRPARPRVLRLARPPPPARGARPALARDAARAPRPGSSRGRAASRASSRRSSPTPSTTPWPRPPRPSSRPWPASPSPPSTSLLFLLLLFFLLRDGGAAARGPAADLALQRRAGGADLRPPRQDGEGRLAVGDRRAPGPGHHGRPRLPDLRRAPARDLGGGGGPGRHGAAPGRAPGLGARGGLALLHGRAHLAVGRAC